MSKPERSPGRPERETTRAALDLAIDSAKAHGEESDPEHEVGDLLELVEALYKHAPESCRRAALLEYGEAREVWGEAIRRSLKP